MLQKEVRRGWLQRSEFRKSQPTGENSAELPNGGGGVPAALPGDLSSAPATACNSGTRGSHTLLWILQLLHSHAETHRDAQMHT